MEKGLSDPDIDVYLTWDVERLPAYGESVVAVVLGDEVGQIPRYVDRVRAVFKCHGTHPVLGSGPLRDPSLKGLLALAQYGVRWAKWLPGGAAHGRRLAGRRLRARRLRRRWSRSRSAPATSSTCRWSRSASAPRTSSSPAAWSTRSRCATGSARRRRARAGSASTPPRRSAGAGPSLRLDLRVTHGFDASVAMSPEVYSRALMDSRGLPGAARHRHGDLADLEGLRYGCVVVADRLPENRFFGGAPILQIDRWNRLEATIAPLLDDPAALRRLARSRARLVARPLLGARPRGLHNRAPKYAVARLIPLCNGERDL